MDKEQGRSGMEKKDTKEQTNRELPLDIALSLLRPDRLEKLKKYIIAYLTKYKEDKEQKNT